MATTKITEAPTVLRAGLYLRQSLDRTGDELAVDRQREDGQALVARRGWTLTREFKDNSVSASGKVRRPQFEALITAIVAGLVDVVVAWSLDRLTRNARDRLALVDACRDAGVMIALVRGSDMDPTTPAGRLALGILGEVAQHEIDQKSDRQRRAWVQAREQGRPVVFSTAPFGWLRDRVTEDPVAGPAIRRAADVVLAGGSLRSIARQWDEAGIPTPNGGKQWGATAIKGILLNPRLAGHSTYTAAKPGERPVNPWEREVVCRDGQWASIVSEDTHLALVAVLTDPARPGTGGTCGVPTTLLGGIAFCPCGQRMQGGQSNGRPILRCCARREGRGSGHVGRLRKPVEEYITGVIVERLSRPDAVELLADDGDDGPDIEALRSERIALRRELDELAEDLSLPLRTVTLRTAKIEARLAEIEDIVTDAERVSVLAPLVAADDVRAAWDGLDLDRKRAVVERLMERIVLHSPGLGTTARTFRPETVTIVRRES